MNSFSSSDAYGAITYYRNGDESSKRCADLIQSSLNTYCSAPAKQGRIGDYYILNCSYYTSILIECGFISNPEEEKLLNTDEYRNKFIDAVYSGILLYFGNSNFLSDCNLIIIFSLLYSISLNGIAFGHSSKRGFPISCLHGNLTPYIEE